MCYAPLRTAEGLELGYRPPTDLTLNPLGTKEMELQNAPFSETKIREQQDWRSSCLMSSGFSLPRLGA